MEFRAKRRPPPPRGFVEASRRKGFFGYLLIFLFISISSFGRDAGEGELAKMHAEVRALYQNTRDPAAIELSRREVSMAEQTYGPDQPEVVEPLYDLARGLTRASRFKEAEPLYSKALDIRKKAFGPDDPQTADALHYLGWFYSDLADYNRAEKLFQQALKIRLGRLGHDHPLTAESFNDLGVLKENMGDYAKARSYYEEALEIQEKTLGLHQSPTATTLNNLAVLDWILGDYEKAETNFNLALATRERVLGPEHPYTSTTLNNLAMLYQSMGDREQAEGLYQRALKIREKTLGPEHGLTLTTLYNLGILYTEEGDDSRARPLLEKTLAFREKILGDNHPDTARNLNQLALLYDRVGETEKAEALFQRALESRRNKLGERHPETAESLGSLARHERLQGKLPEAVEYYREALDIEKSLLGPTHPQTLRNLEGLAYAEWESGQGDAALDDAQEVVEGWESFFNDFLGFTSEQQRLEFQKTVNPCNLPANLGNAPEIAETVLRTKGLVLDSILEDHLAEKTIQDDETRSLQEELRGVTRRLARDWAESFLENPAGNDRPSLEREKRRLESLLCRKLSGPGKLRWALSVTKEQVQAVLPAHSILVEFIRYDQDLGKLKFESRYGALLLPPEGDPTWVPLGGAEELEKETALFQKYVRRHIRQTTFQKVLQNLHREIWAPLEEKFPSLTRTVIISPDGELNFLSFATLLDTENRFLADQYSIQYVSSGRDLLWNKTLPTESRDLVVFANPDFMGKIRSSQPDPPPQKNDFLKIPAVPQLAPLPGAEEEAAFLRRSSKEWGLAPNIYLGLRASKKALSQWKSPKILHLATHGFFLPANSENSTLRPPNSALNSALLDPMQRSILVLAGAQRALNSWQSGSLEGSAGVLTAREVGDLDLEGTWLASLSGCDTGCGEARAGEGVLGLRRGFIQAGVRNLLMTLWPVGDHETVQIMEDFYTRAIQTGNPPRALSEVQGNWLNQLRKDQGLTMAVRLAGPFMMTFQGKPLGDRDGRD